MSEGWVIPGTAAEVFREVAKRIHRQERRPSPLPTESILGPGMAAQAVQIIDWDTFDSTLNGYYWSAPGAAGVPDPALSWTGQTIARDDGSGMQQVWNIDTDLQHWTRTFVRSVPVAVQPPVRAYFTAVNAVTEPADATPQADVDDTSAAPFHDEDDSTGGFANTNHRPGGSDDYGYLIADLGFSELADVELHIRVAAWAVNDAPVLTFRIEVLDEAGTVLDTITPSVPALDTITAFNIDLNHITGLQDGTKQIRVSRGVISSPETGVFGLDVYEMWLQDGANLPPVTDGTLQFGEWKRWATASGYIEIEDIGTGLMGLISEGGPTDPPEDSPLVTTYGTIDAIVLTAEPVAQSSQIIYQVSNTYRPEDGTGVWADLPNMPTRSNVYVAAFDAVGEPFEVERTYYFRAIATNSVGEALASAPVPGQLDPERASTVVASRIISGIVMAGRFESGNGYWDPNEGLVLPQPDGSETRLSTDGVTPSTLSGYVAAKYLSMKAGDVRGPTYVSAGMKMTDGIQNPAVAPTVTTSWKQAARLEAPDGEEPNAFFDRLNGLQFNYDRTAWVSIESVKAGVLGLPRMWSWPVAGGKPTLITELGLNSDKCGLAVLRKNTLADSRWVLGVPGAGANPTTTKLVKYVMDGTSYFESGATESATVTHPAMTARSAVGTEGTGVAASNPALAVPHSPSEVSVYRAPGTTGQLVHTVTTGTPSWWTDLAAFNWDYFDYSTVDFRFAFTQRAPVGASWTSFTYVYNDATGAYEVKEWPNPGPPGFMRGVFYDYGVGGTLAGKFYQLDHKGVIYEMTNKQTLTNENIGYAWYNLLSDWTTEQSPTALVNRARRQWIQITTPHPPDSGVSGTQVANRVRIYHDSKVALTGEEGQNVFWLAPDVATGDLEQPFNDFAGVGNLGMIYSDLGSGLPALHEGWEFHGDGYGRIGPLEFNSDQQIVVPQEYGHYLSGFFPVGGIIMWGGLSTAPPAGWLYCNGGQFSGAAYPLLAALLGSRFGAISGDLYRLPNYGGRFPYGQASAGGTGGSGTKTIAAANLPAHAHGAGSLSAVTDGSHSHTLHRGGSAGNGAYIMRSTAENVANGGPIDPSGDHTHSITGSTDNGPGSGTALDIMPPWLGTIFIIRAV